MTNKMTNKKALEYVLTTYANLPDDVRGKLESMAASLEKKSAGGTRKPTAKQIENEALRKAILETLRNEPDRLFTCMEISKAIPELNGESNQKISALMKSLVDNGSVDKTTEKGKALFRIAAEENAGE